MMLFKSPLRPPAGPCRSLADEAESCRKVAVELAGRPEQGLLLKLAQAFEELARSSG
jgi:hypothetical protein